MKKIYVKDISMDTSTSVGGDMLYNVLLEFDNTQELVDISFSGLLCPTSSYLNASLVRLLEGEKKHRWQGRLKVSGLNSRNATFIKEYVSKF